MKRTSKHEWLKPVALLAILACAGSRATVNGISSSIRLRKPENARLGASKSSGIRRFDYHAAFGPEAAWLLNHHSIAKLM